VQSTASPHSTLPIENHKSKQFTVNFRHLLSSEGGERVERGLSARARVSVNQTRKQRSKPSYLTTFFVAGETLRGTF
jgi:hypothetical protein